MEKGIPLKREDGLLLIMDTPKGAFVACFRTMQFFTFATLLTLLYI